MPAPPRSGPTPPVKKASKASPKKATGKAQAVVDDGTPLDSPRLQVPAGRLLSIGDVAKLAGRDRTTVDSWRVRDKRGRSEAHAMPKPILPRQGDVDRKPMWDRDEIVSWLKVTGRWDTRTVSQ